MNHLNPRWASKPKPIIVHQVISHVIEYIIHSIKKQATAGYSYKIAGLLNFV